MRLFLILYSTLSYLLFLASILYAIGFVGDLAVPKSINQPPGPGGWLALLVNAAVLGLFAVQHSVMARPAFKRWWTRFVPDAIERSTYVMLSSLCLFLVYAAWQPLPGVVWDVRGTAAGSVLLACFAIGWAVVVLSTFMISHFELFGLTQAWRRLRETPAQESVFKEVLFYRFVRHPIMLGFLIAFWSAPLMTHGRLLFALLTTGYIFVGIRLEEHDLVRKLGSAYLAYRMRVPALLPLPRLTRRHGAAGPTPMP
ncbi:MAG: isoprenylcysteine carboxylmethyltransferase family protein [Lysobacteraceae bacterium]|nr:MAG: isoprenylcysteine carboxylmethyltransferase family protein [Xanthomonadaceae bacterium]